MNRIKRGNNCSIIEYSSCWRKKEAWLAAEASLLRTSVKHNSLKIIEIGLHGNRWKKESSSSERQFNRVREIQNLLFPSGWYISIYEFLVVPRENENRLLYFFAFLLEGEKRRNRKLCGTWSHCPWANDLLSEWSLPDKNGVTEGNGFPTFSEVPISKNWKSGMSTFWSWTRRLSLRTEDVVSSLHSIRLSYRIESAFRKV